MTTLRQVLLAVVLLALTAGCDTLPTQSGSPAAPRSIAGASSASTPTILCANQPVPAGYVVVGVTTAPACPYNSGVANTLTIRTPTSPMAICARVPVTGGYVSQSVPAGYVMVGVTNASACPSNNGAANALTIRTPASPVAICARVPVTGGHVGQAIPAGYVLVGVTNLPACPANNGAANALTIRTPTSPMAICARVPVTAGDVGQPVPGKYVLVGVTNVPACPANNGAANALSIRTPTSPMSICARVPVTGGHVTQAVPAGYVLVGVTNVTTCPANNGAANALSIRTPTSPMTICARVPVTSGQVSQAVPAGYVLVGVTNTSACPANNGAATALSIRTPASPMTICARVPVTSGDVIQPVPAKYLVVGVTNAPACPANNGAANALSIRTPTSPMTICARVTATGANVIQAVPAGYVLVGVTNAPACPVNNGAANALSIRTPASPVWICARVPVTGGDVSQAVPAGYVMMGMSNVPACPANNGAANALGIRTPLSPMTICARVPAAGGYGTQAVPAGYVVTGVTTVLACPYNDGAATALSIRTPTSPMTICARVPVAGGYVNQPVPAGYEVVGVANVPACPSNNGAANALTIRNPTAPVMICARKLVTGGYVTQSVPAGYVLVGVTYASECPSDGGGANALIIRIPVSPMTICARVPVTGGYVSQSVPLGYVVVGVTYVSECPSDGGGANALIIRTPASPMTICARRPVTGGYVSQSVPLGYVVVGVTYVSECPSDGGGANAQVIQRV